MLPVIGDIRPGLQPKGTFQRCWNVHYQFCGVSAAITVYAESETEARAKAVDQLRLRGLKVA